MNCITPSEDSSADICQDLAKDDDIFLRHYPQLRLEGFGIGNLGIDYRERNAVHCVLALDADVTIVVVMAPNIDASNSAIWEPGRLMTR